MAIEQVSLVAGGYGVTDFEQISVTLGTNATPPKFEARLAEVGGPTNGSPFDVWKFPPGTVVQIYAGRDMLLDGIVEDYEPSASATTHNVVIRGVGKQREYTRSAAQSPTGRFENQSILQIAQALGAPYGIAVTAAAGAASAAAEIIPWFQIRLGSTPWDEVLRLAAQRGMTMHGTRDGKVELFRGQNGYHTGGLYQGRNMIHMSAKLSDKYVFDKTQVVGQNPMNYNKLSVEPFGEAQGNGAPGSKTQIVDSAVTDQPRAQNHAGWIRDRAQSESKIATITTPGWRDDNGALWVEGQQVFVFSPFLKLEQNMLIKQVAFHQDAIGGTTAVLDLVQPEGFGGTAAGGGAVQPWTVF